MVQLHPEKIAPRSRGHSLVELLIVIGIISLVIGMIVGVFYKVYRVIESWN